MPAPDMRWTTLARLVPAISMHQQGVVDDRPSAFNMMPQKVSSETLKHEVSGSQVRALQQEFCKFPKKNLPNEVPGCCRILPCAESVLVIIIIILIFINADLTVITILFVIINILNMIISSFLHCSLHWCAFL